jgi:thiamine pyrophosphokinase
MSSHHIVRENQEPALLVEDFYALSAEYLGQILEWSPTIITNEVNLDYFLSQDIKVDFLYAHKIDTTQEDVQFIIPKSTFLKDSLDYLIEKNYKAVNILSNSLDPHFLDVAKHINIVVFKEGIRYVLIQFRYEKWIVKGQKIYINVADIKSFNGLKYLHDNVFEVERDGFVQLEMNKDSFVFVGEEI